MGAQVSRSDFWRVELKEAQQLTVNTGDMILVKSRTLAFVPANLKKTFDVTYDRSRFRLIAEKPPEGEGSIGKQYYFLAVASGTSEITIQIKDLHGEVVEAIKLEVTCR